ncbi:hypothetical protein LTR56_024971 [Elasticomyces elasticus]|nr:hypothetical protein LTR56_024971 [Elasticomyces elasticus]KAK3631039.1 hypothetical protein LTR22_021265 [Elasticomyces elasticus]KAK5753358.1 hypothetical protein LTS12_016601 [Elasticomyces elasticus]
MALLVDTLAMMAMVVGNYARVITDSLMPSGTPHDVPTPPVLMCDHGHRYTTEILSLSPLMIYINDFVKEDERLYLLNIGNDSYDGRLFVQDPLEDGKSPRSGHLPKSDPITPWLAKYEPSQKVHPHLDPPADFMLDSQGLPYNWLTSFFVYLDASGSGGETYFPLIKALPADDYREDARFSLTNTDMGIAIRPVPGNAVFWVNIYPNGTRDEATVHAGVTLESGTKTGMNIWAKQYKWPF